MKRRFKILLLTIVVAILSFLSIEARLNRGSFHDGVIAFCDKSNWPIPSFYNWRMSYCANDFDEMRDDGKGGYYIHHGVDMNLGLNVADLGVPVSSTHEGVVTIRTYESDKNGGGNRVTVIYGKVSTLYLHLNEILVKEGQKVTKGTKIGTIGGSGKGKKEQYVPHLHYALKINGEYVNPVEKGNLRDVQKMITKYFKMKSEPKF